MKIQNLAAFIIMLTTAISASADTLENALTKAYEYNPALKAARCASHR